MLLLLNSWDSKDSPGTSQGRVRRKDNREWTCARTYRDGNITTEERQRTTAEVISFIRGQATLDARCESRSRIFLVDDAFSLDPHFVCRLFASYDRTSRLNFPCVHSS